MRKSTKTLLSLIASCGLILAGASPSQAAPVTYWQSTLTSGQAAYSSEATIRGGYMYAEPGNAATPGTNYVQTRAGGVTRFSVSGYGAISMNHAATAGQSRCYFILSNNLPEPVKCQRL